MGYCMLMREADFEIPAEKTADALAAVKSLDPKLDGATGGRFGPGAPEQRWFAWVDTEEYKNAKTLEEALLAWRWELISDADGNYCDIIFGGEKLGDDMVLFEALAPYVKPGSYIEMAGEDNALWRWVFDGKTMREISPTLIWE